MTAAEIAAALGSARREGRDWRCICPTHGGASLTLRDGRSGLLVKCWAGCSGNEVLAELRRLGLLAGRSDGTPPASRPASSNDRAEAERRIALARRVWDAARDARGSPVVRYLAGRGIAMPVPPSLRWAPALRRPDGTYGPAMVARVDGLDGELIGVHRTWLVCDASGVWQRHYRAMLGRPAGGAVRLGAAREDMPLVVGEGIESCFGAMQTCDLPGWAALSAIGIERLILPTELRDVLIAVDRDSNGTGERAARQAGRQWLAEGRRVRLLIPHVVGADAADLIGDARHAA